MADGLAFLRQRTTGALRDSALPQHCDAANHQKRRQENYAPADTSEPPHESDCHQRGRRREQHQPGVLPNDFERTAGSDGVDFFAWHATSMPGRQGPSEAKSERSSWLAGITRGVVKTVDMKRSKL